MPIPKQVSFIPDTLDLALYAGDGASMKLTVTDNSSSPLLVEGEITAQIRKTRLEPDALAEFSVVIDTGEVGAIFVSLTGEQTAALLGGKKSFKGVWDVQWVKPDAEPITLLQGAVECNADVTR